jgi:hypothetical protein
VAQLILRRASASRPSGEWNDDDFDVLAGNVVVGRIMKAAAAPVGTPWLWTLATTGIARLRTAMKQRARMRWRHSPRAGGAPREGTVFSCHFRFGTILILSTSCVIPLIALRPLAAWQAALLVAIKVANRASNSRADSITVVAALR